MPGFLQLLSLSFFLLSPFFLPNSIPSSPHSSLIPSIKGNNRVFCRLSSEVTPSQETILSCYQVEKKALGCYWAVDICWGQAEDMQSLQMVQYFCIKE